MKNRETASKSVVLAVTADQSLMLMQGLPEFLVQKGWLVDVISSPGPRLSALQATGAIRAKSISMRRNPSPLHDFAALIAWVRSLRELRPAAVWVGTPKAALLGTVAGWLLRVPTRVYVVRGLRLETTSGAMRKLLAGMEKLTFAMSTHAIAVSPSLKDEIIRLNLSEPQKVVVLGQGSSNGVDVKRFHTRDIRDEDVAVLRARFGLVDGVPVIGFVGRLTADKGLALLNAAVERLIERGVELQLLIIGGHEGEEPADLVPLDRSRVFHTGHVDDTSPYYGLIDVLCLPTRREGFPNVVLEAAASGVPTVTTNATGAVDSVLDYETGRVVQQDNADELADALETLLMEPSLRARYGERARVWVTENFAQPLVWERIDKHLNEALITTRRKFGRGQRKQSDR